MCTCIAEVLMCRKINYDNAACLVPSLGHPETSLTNAVISSTAL